MAETTGLTQKVLEGEAPDASAGQRPVKPTASAVAVAALALVAGVLLAWLADLGDQFTPRVKTLDALAGLTIGAFAVERLLNFVPPIRAYGARGNKAPDTDKDRELRIKQRSADVAFVRVGFGVLLGGLFVAVTDLRAVKVLTEESGVDPQLDRVLAALAIAGGVAGLASLLAGINPQTDTDPKAKTDAAQPGETPTVPPASDAAYGVGIVLVAAAAGLALLGADKTTGLDLLVPSGEGDGTVDVVVRFGVVILLAAVVQQVVERCVYPLVAAEENRKLVTGGVAVFLGVVAALLVDLYLMHNIGFFGVEAGESIDDVLGDSSWEERWFDTFVTGVVIAAGTKPLHDLTSGLKKRTGKKETVAPIAGTTEESQPVVPEQPPDPAPA
jgi:hypothetical protein